MQGVDGWVIVVEREREMAHRGGMKGGKGRGEEDMHKKLRKVQESAKEVEGVVQGVQGGGAKRGWPVKVVWWSNIGRACGGRRAEPSQR